MPSFHGSFGWMCLSAARRRGPRGAHCPSALLCLGLLTWVGSFSGGCRDLRADVGYCSSCPADGGVLAPGAGSAANGGEPSTGQTTQPVATAGNGSGTMTGSGGTRPPGSTAPGGGSAAPSAGSTGSNAGRAGSAAASGGSTGGAGGAASQPPSGGRPAGAAGSSEAGRGGSASTPVDAGAMPEPDPEDPPPEEPPPEEPPPEEPQPEPEPCGASCPADFPVCNLTTQLCVQCTPEDKQACTGDTRTCDRLDNRCVECSLEDDSSCRANGRVCDVRTRTCVSCLSTRPESCGGQTPVCNDATQSCVECTLTQPQACQGDRPICSPERNSCVQCLTFNDCSGRPDRPRCDDNTCQACRSPMDCASIDGKPACNNGTCVACTADSNTCPLGQRCNTNSFTCEQEPEPEPPVTRVELCEPCTSDAACPDNARCAATGLPGQTFCLPNASGRSCNSRIYRMPIPLDNNAFVCGPQQASCQAVRETIASRECNPAGGGCTALDSTCVPVNDDMGRCSYSCATNNDCPESFRCANEGLLGMVCRR